MFMVDNQNMVNFFVALYHEIIINIICNYIAGVDNFLMYFGAL